jgi:putative DNA primase/helicase
MTKLKTVSRANPCPVCGGDHKCARGEDGLLVCGREGGDVAGFIRLKPAEKDPQFTLYRKEDDPALLRNQRPHCSRTKASAHANGKPQEQPIDWAARAETFARALSPERRYELAGSLGVPECVLGRLAVGWNEEQECWTFAERDGTGQIIGINRRYRDGRKQAMAGGQRGLTVPEGWRAMDSPIFCPEGPSDVLALTAMHLAAVGRPSNRAGVEYLAELLRDVPASRPIIVLAEMDPKPDGKWPGRDGAEATASRLAEELGAGVSWALPPGGAKDARAWLQAQQPDLTCADLLGNLGERFAAAIMPMVVVASVKISQSPEPPTGPHEVNETHDDPHRLARGYRSRHRGPEGEEGLYFWREEYLRWNEGAYHSVHAKEVKAGLTQSIKGTFDRINCEQMRKWRENRGTAGDKPKPPPEVQPVTTHLVGNAAQALAGLSLLPSTVEPPAWLGGEGPFPADEVLACRNGLLHLPSLADGRGLLLPPSAKFFARNALGYDYRPDAPEPKEWLSFLRQVWPDDHQAIDALQEWCGYCLTTDTRQQKILMLVGPRRGGKGTIARVLTRIIGSENVCAPTLGSLGTNFGLQPLLGKTLAIVSDARLSGRTDVAVVTERLLSISGEDGQTVDRKHMSAVTHRLPVRFMILTNELPRLSDASGALVGRLLVLRLTESWYGREDTRLTDRLLAELPGILLWAIEGWRRLRERGRFMQPKSAGDMIHDLEDLSSPISAFVRDECWVGPEHRVSVSALFEVWRLWCERVGRKEAGTLHTFGRDLRAALPSLAIRQHRVKDEKVRRVYFGIGLRAEEASPGE